MFNKRRNSGSIPPNRLKTYGFPRTDIMKNGANKVWLQKNPNVIRQTTQTVIKESQYRKKMSNKGGKGIKCPDCP